MGKVQTRRTVCLAPALFTRLEKRATKENVPKSAIVENLIQQWAGVTPPKKKKVAPLTKVGRRFIVNVDLFVSAEKEEEALQEVRRLLRDEGIQGTPYCADKDG